MTEVHHSRLSGDVCYWGVSVKVEISVAMWETSITGKSC